MGGLKLRWAEIWWAETQVSSGITSRRVGSWTLNCGVMPGGAAGLLARNKLNLRVSIKFSQVEVIIRSEKYFKERGVICLEGEVNVARK